MQAKKGSSIMLDISIYLDGIHAIMLIHGKAVDLTFIRSCTDTLLVRNIFY